MAHGDETPDTRPLRPAAPIVDGPLASSGTAPDRIPGQRPPSPPESVESSATGPAPEPAATATTATATTATTAATATAGARVARWRIPSPARVVIGSGRAVRDWSRRPAGRLTVPALLLLALVAGAGTAGALLVPVAAGDPKPVASGGEDPAAGAPTPVDPGLTPAPTDFPGGLPPNDLPPAEAAGPPAVVLTEWAAQVGARVAISDVAMRAYGYAELVIAQTTPGCRLTWTTLAAIGFVESNHGRANGATLQPDGLATPHIIGLPLDGAGGRQRIMDTDGGQLDGDVVYDRAVGPMQFIPTTWQQDGVDADNDGVKNPHDLDDAALAAGNYLCKGGRDLSTAEDWWSAILSYNDVRSYAQAVFDTANRYGTQSRT